MSDVTVYDHGRHIYALQLIDYLTVTHYTRVQHDYLTSRQARLIFESGIIRYGAKQHLEIDCADN